MRAWTNQLSNFNKLLILPVSLIFVILGITIAHSQNSQTQPIQPHLVSTYGTDESLVERQQAYEIPAVAEDYTSDNSQQSTDNITIASPPALALNTRQPAPSNDTISHQQPPATNSQPQAKSSSAQNNSSSAKLNLILGAVVLINK